MGHEIFDRVFIGARNKLMSFRGGTKLFQEIEMKILEIVFYFVRCRRKFFYGGFTVFLRCAPQANFFYGDRRKINVAPHVTVKPPHRKTP